ncbi:MAG: hypothetical protein HY267_01605 [Deltaproteobacteria bacterium]|nr:hypothetical protein [Deltaproteobacteria bacterium]
MKRPEEVTLSREEGEALIERIEHNELSTEDRRVLVEVLTFYFWLLFVLREAKLSLKRVKALVFGEKAKKREPPESGGSSSCGGGGTGAPPSGAQEVQASSESMPTKEKTRLPGHGRHGAEAYRAAQTVACYHDELAVGERCPACGRGRLYRLPPGIEMRLDGNALLSAVRYELEKLRCSACGQIFTAPLPAGAWRSTVRAHGRC